jgi:hypothetical protein
MVQPRELLQYTLRVATTTTTKKTLMRNNSKPIEENFSTGTREKTTKLHEILKTIIRQKINPQTTTPMKEETE